MKARRKLIPAIVLLLVSVLMLSTASYAWFANTTEVTASGMSITAQAPSNLKIKKVDNTWDAVASISGKSGLKMTNARSAIDAETGAVTFTTFAPKADGTLAVDAVASNVGTISEEKPSGSDVQYGFANKDQFGANVKTYYYAKATYDLVYELEEDATTTGSGSEFAVGLTEITLSVVKELNKNVYKAAKVIATCGTANETFEFDATVDSTGSNVTHYILKLTSSKVLNANVSTDKTNPTQIVVYFFFDGDSEFCKTAQIGAEAINFSLTFGKITSAA